MPRYRLSHLYNKIHVRMFFQVATRDCKQYLQQLMIPESVMGVYRKGGVVASEAQIRKANLRARSIVENR